MNVFTNITAVAALFAVGAIAAPEMTGEITSRIVAKAEAIFAPDCDNSPLACLDRRETALRDAVANTNSVAAELKAREEEAGEVAAKAEQSLARNKLFLEEGRRIFTAGGPGPFTFVGVSYSAEALEQQLRLTFAENKLLEANQETALATKEGLATARRDLKARETTMRAALEILPAQRSLISAEGMVAKVGENLAEIDAMLETGHRVRSNAQDTLLRSTTELTSDAAAGLATVAPGGSFDVWMRGAAN